MKKQTWQKWARACVADSSSPTALTKGSLAALTGQDTRALNAIVACLELYASSDDAGSENALEAIRVLLPAMQASTRWLVKEIIPFVLDWGDRDRVWDRIDDGSG